MKDFSVFNTRERAANEQSEAVFLMVARKGNIKPLFGFWHTKRVETINRFQARYEPDGRKKCQS